MSHLLFPQTKYPLSVVIATLGGDSLSRTIEQLNRGTIVPMEILVCIPEEEVLCTDKLSFHNVQVVRTTCRGQVAQRAVGFQRASCDLVLQLDDDIYVRETCIEYLVARMSTFLDVAVGPKLHDAQSGEYHSFMIPAAGKNSFFEKLLFWVANGVRGYEPGQIGRAGVSMGVPEEPGDWDDLGWLPGGCMLHRKNNLVLFDFYPFKGKAFAEDLFHSVLLKRKGVRLIRSGAAICDVDFTSSFTSDPIGFVKAYRAYAKALRRLVGICGGSVPFLYLYLLLDVIGRGARKAFPAKTS